MSSEDLELGPVDIVVIGFPAEAPRTGEAIPIFLDLVERGIVRVLDVLMVQKEEDGSVSGLELDTRGGTQIRNLEIDRLRFVNSKRLRHRNAGILCMIDTGLPCHVKNIERDMAEQAEGQIDEQHSKEKRRDLALQPLVEADIGGAASQTVDPIARQAGRSMGRSPPNRAHQVGRV